MSILALLITCGATGFAIRLLRRWPRLVFAATSAGLIGLIIILAAAPTIPYSLLGRTVALGYAERIFLWPAVAVAAALAFFGPLTFDKPGDAPALVLSNSQGAFFFWSLAPLILAMTLDSFPLASFLWAIGLMLLVLLAQPRRKGRTGGAAQFLLLMIIATASLLLSNRFLELYPLTPENVDLVQSAFLFLAWGLGLLLSVAPLHIWLGPLADEMPILAMAFLVGVAQPVGLWLLFQLMSRMLWLTEKSPLLYVLLLGGLVTVPVGALLCVAEKRHGRFLAYLSLVSLGHALIGFGLGTGVGLASAMAALLNRALGAAILAGGMTFTRHHEEKRWQFVGAFSIVAGGFALAGIPPLLGAAARWGIYRQVGPAQPFVLILLIASSLLAFLGTLRFAYPVFAEASAAVQSTGEIKIVPYLCSAVILLLLVVLLVTGFFPQLVADPLLVTLGQADYLR